MTSLRWGAYIRFLPFLLANVTGMLGMFWAFSLTGFMEVSEFSELQRLMARTPFQQLQPLIGLVILLDCLTAAFAYRKRAVHDMMAGSYCIYDANALRRRQGATL